MIIYVLDGWRWVRQNGKSRQSARNGGQFVIMNRARSLASQGYFKKKRRKEWKKNEKEKTFTANELFHMFNT